MNTIDKNPSVLKNEFKSRRIAGIMYSLLFAFLTGALIYDFNYLQESFLKTGTLVVMPLIAQLLELKLKNIKKIVNF